jgi:hypothetical protein
MEMGLVAIKSAAFPKRLTCFEFAPLGPDVLEV